jgi:TP901 family phage tail tape measure protein
MAEQVIAEYKLQVDQAVKGLDKLQNETRQLGKDFNKTGSDGKKSMNEVGNSANNLGKSFKNLGTQILSAFGLVGAVYTFIAAIKNGVSAAAEFEKQMSIVKALTNATNKEFQQLQASAKQLGSSTKFTATQVGQLQEEFAKLGFTTDEIIAASEATLALASAAGTDLATAASVAGQVIRSFGLDAEETIRVVDVMALSFTKSALNVSNFEEAMKYVAPIARVANIDLETTVALLSKLADSGLRGSIAGTGLKNLLSKLADENSDLSKQLGYSVKGSEDLFRALSDLKNANIDLTAATELTDERSKAAFLTLIDGAEDIRTLAGEYDNAQGSALKMSETMEDNVIGAVTKLSSAWEGLMIQIAGSNGYLRTFVELMTKYVNLTQKVFASDKDRLEQDIASNAESGKRNALTMKQINILKEVNMALGANEDALNASFSAKISDNIDNLNKKIQEQKDIIKDPYVTDVNLRAAQLLLARYEAELDATVKTQEKFNESLSESGGAADAVNVYVRSIAQLQEELKKLQEDFKNVEIGSQQWFDLIEKMFNKTEELNDANEELAYRLAVLDGAFDKYEDIETKGIDDFTKSVEKASAALKKAKEEAQIKSLQLTDDENIDPSKGFPGITSEEVDDDKVTFADLGQELEDALQLWSDFYSQLSEMQQAQNQLELSLLDKQLASEEITREQYEERKSQLQRKAAAQQKSAALFGAIINTAAAVVTALNTQPFLPLGPIMAAIAAASGAAQIATIASTPLPAFAEGVIGLQGAGTETSDSIHAKLSKGESVMTAAETKQYNAELWAIRRGNFEDLIMTKYVKPMIDESLFKGFADIGRSAELNGITANLKDHNILHGLDRLRQSQQQGFHYLAKELKVKNQKRGGYRA